MADPVTALDTKDLRTLTLGTPVKVVVVDKDKVEHLLNPLDMNDVVEYQDKIGHNILAVDHELTVKDILTLVYLSLRKEGLSAKQIEKKEWKYTERQVGAMFDMKFFTLGLNLLMDILRVSGFELKDDADKNKTSTGREKDIPENPPPASATAV